MATASNKEKDGVSRTHHFLGRNTAIAVVAAVVFFVFIISENCVLSALATLGPFIQLHPFSVTKTIPEFFCCTPLSGMCVFTWASDTLCCSKIFRGFVVLHSCFR